MPLIEAFGFNEYRWAASLARIDLGSLCDVICDVMAIVSDTSSISQNDVIVVVAMGESELLEQKRPLRVIQFPCFDQRGPRPLAKGTLVDLGASRMQPVGTGAVIQMQVISSTCLACEIHKSVSDT